MLRSFSVVRLRRLDRGYGRRRGFMTSQMPQGAKKPACNARGLIFAKVASPILLDAVLLVELINASAGIDELLLAGEERMAL